MKVKKFHQFIVLEKGPVNTAILPISFAVLYAIHGAVQRKVMMMRTMKARMNFGLPRNEK